MSQYLFGAAAAGGKTGMIEMEVRALLVPYDLPIMDGYRADMTREEFAETWASGDTDLLEEGRRAFDLVAAGKSPFEIVDLLMEGRYDDGDEPSP